MANLTERDEYTAGVRMIEPGDSVIGGPNAPINLPFNALANRTLWLKNQLAAAVQSINTNQTNANNTYATKTDVSNAATAVKNDILGGAGAAFDTLKELAAALGNDANFANTITRELAKKADKATTLAGYGLGNAIAVLTGTIADGGTIPLPAGFSEAQCKFMVSMSEDDPTYVPWDINENGNNRHYYTKCYVTDRVVTAKVYHGSGSAMQSEGWLPGRANYLVIAYK